MKTCLSPRLTVPSLLALVFVWLAAVVIPCTALGEAKGQKAVIYSPSPCDITCEEIVDPTCHFATYTYTGFPNLLGHTKQGYVQQFDHLIEVLELCYSHSMEFLCGILTPHCVEGVGLMLPTKRMCHEFHEACDEFIEEAGHSFLMDCHDLPEEENAPPVCIHFPTAPPGHTLPPEPTPRPLCSGSSAISGYSLVLFWLFTCLANVIIQHLN